MVSAVHARSLDAKDSLAHVRNLFELPEGVIFMDANSVGPMPKAVRAKAQGLLDRLPPELATRSSYVRMLLIGLLLQLVLQKFRAGLIPEKSPPVRFDGA